MHPDDAAKTNKMGKLSKKDKNLSVMAGEGKNTAVGSGKVEEKTKKPVRAEACRVGEGGKVGARHKTRRGRRSVKNRGKLIHKRKDYAAGGECTGIKLRKSCYRSLGEIC